MARVYNTKYLLMPRGPDKDTPAPRRISLLTPVLLCVIVLAFQSGCESTRRFDLLSYASLNPPVPKTEHQTTLGKVAVVAGVQQPEIKFEGFARGKGEGAAKGAWDTFWSCAGALGQGGCSGDFCGAAIIIWLGVCGVSSAVGGVVGAAEATNADDVRSAQANMSAALKVTTIQESLRDQIASAAIANGANLTSISPQAARETAQTRDYRSLASEGVDTVLEATLTKAGTSGSGINDPLQAYMEAHIRLIRTADNNEVFSCDYTYRGERLKLSDWAANQGEQLLRSLNTGYERLGSHVYDSVFLLYPFPDRWPHSAGGLLSLSVGLAPISPATRGPPPPDDTFFSWVTVDELQPTFRWQSFPRETDVRLLPEEMGRVKNVTYDLIIARERNLAPAEVVYRREGLPDSVHTIETPLIFTTRYFWTVRARFELDGRQRVTEWGSTYYRVWDQFTAPTSFSYRFETP